MTSPSETSSTPPLAGIFSSGRSGSTWLGSIFDSSPEVAYRFEPFHRTSKASKLWSIRQRLFDGDTSEDLLESLYRQLLKANAAWDKPPFFPKRWGGGSARRLLWPAARKFTALSLLFRSLNTPPGRPKLVFKEIDNVWMLALLAHKTGAPLIYLLRHPCAVVASMLAGVERSVMSSGRLQYLGSRLREHGYSLGEDIPGQLNEWSDAQKFAWMWRLDVESALDAAETSKSILVQGYEQLCLDPIGQSKRAFAHAQIPWNDQTAAFVSASTEQDGDSSSNDTRDAYFQVHRDPSVTISRWRSRLAQEHIDAVLAVAQGSSYWPKIDALTRDSLD